MSQDPATFRKSPFALLILAWGLVSIPLAWGVYETILKSTPLFTGK